MSDLLIVRLGEDPTAPLAWAAFTGAVLDETNRSPNLAAFCDVASAFGDAVRVAAVLPGETVALRPLPSPPKSQAKFRSAAELLLEDELAEPVEALHVAVGVVDGVGRTYALKRSIMDLWTTAFRDHGIPLHTLTPDYGCLGGTVGRPVLFIETQRIVASTGERGFAAENPIGRAAVKAMIADHDPEKVGIYGPSAWLSKLNADLYEQLGPADGPSLLQAAAVALGSEGDAVNLLQGPYRPARAPTIDVVRWRRAAAMAASLAAAYLAFVAAEGVQSGRIADRYASETRRIHETYFPDAANVDPRANAREVLAAGGGGASFLQIANRLSAALDDNESVAIDRIRFDGARGQFVFSIRSQSDADIDAFRRVLDSHGLTARDVNCCRQSSGSWIGDLTASIK